MPSTEPSKRAGGQEAEQAGDLDDARRVLAAVQRADRETARTVRCVVGLVERLGGGHLHRLHLGHDLALDVAGDDDAERGDEGDDRAEPGGPAVHRASSAGVACLRSSQRPTPMTTAPPTM